jgi:hypothetical protein
MWAIGFKEYFSEFWNWNDMLNFFIFMPIYHMVNVSKFTGPTAFTDGMYPVIPVFTWEV